jgi:ketopantoate hydroxymethyltransferase
MKRTILNLFKNKLNNVRSVGITSYDYPTSRIINNCNVDFIIVGDTAGSTVHGIKNLNEVSRDVQDGTFPDDKHSYEMKKDELEKLLGMSSSSWKYH